MADIGGGEGPDERGRQDQDDGNRQLQIHVDLPRLFVRSLALVAATLNSTNAMRDGLVGKVTHLRPGPHDYAGPNQTRLPQTLQSQILCRRLPELARTPSHPGHHDADGRADDQGR